MSLFDELKRRNVFRVAIAYAMVGWLIMQVTDTFAPALRLPEWFPTAVAFLLIIGFPLAVFFAWAFEITPEGIKRESEIESGHSMKHTNARKLDRMIIVALLAVVAVLLIDRHMGKKTAAPLGEPPTETATASESAASSEPATAAVAIEDNRASVAVLPFVNMSDDRQNEYFSDGISEELLNTLVRIENLRVPSRTSSFTFKGTDKKLAEIGRDLGVEHILEGSVRKAGNQVRVTAQLIEVASDTHLWSATYTRELNDIFAVQDEIAHSIVSALQQELSSQDQQTLTRRSTDNVEAYNKYLLGRHLWNMRTAPRLLAAIGPLQEAIALDPAFEEAWSALADTYLAIPEYLAGRADEYIPLALEAANMALAINPDSAHALVNLAYYKANYEYDWEGANADFERALELEPNNARFHQWFGSILNTQGQLDRALHHLRIARSLDPLSLPIRHMPGYFLLWRFRLDEAEMHYRDASELGQQMRWSLHNMDFLNCFRGNWDEAREYARQLAEMEGFDPAADLARIDAMEDPALKERALLLLEQRQDMGDTVFGKALQYAVLGEYELAMGSLERAFAAGDSYSAQINYMKVFDPLRDDPRFQALLRKMNLPP